MAKRKTTPKHDQDIVELAAETFTGIDLTGGIPSPELWGRYRMFIALAVHMLKRDDPKLCTPLLPEDAAATSMSFAEDLQTIREKLAAVVEILEAAKARLMIAVARSVRAADARQEVGKTA